METGSQGTWKSGLIFPGVALAASVLCLLALVVSGFGTRLGLWDFRTGFAIIKWSAPLGLVSALLALLAAIASLRNRRFLGVLVALLAFALGTTVFAVPYSWKLKAQKYPRIHDITTDLDNPPKFVAVLLLRQGPVAYGGAAVAAQQMQAYPDLRTLILAVPAPQAFQAAREVAKEMGWHLVDEAPAEGRIEATDTTFWYGFKDDIVIRIVPAGDRSLVDVRSVSRVGISDVGTNAKRIRAFLARLSNQRPHK